MSRNNPNVVDCYQDSQRVPLTLANGTEVMVLKPPRSFLVRPRAGMDPSLPHRLDRQAVLQAGSRYPLPVSPAQEHKANERRRTRGW